MRRSCAVPFDQPCLGVEVGRLGRFADDRGASNVRTGLSMAGQRGRGRALLGLVSGVRFNASGLVIIGTQLNGNANYLGPAIVFALVDMIAAILVALALGRSARAIARGSGSAAPTSAVPMMEGGNKMPTT